MPLISELRRVKQVYFFEFEVYSESSGTAKEGYTEETLSQRPKITKTSLAS